MKIIVCLDCGQEIVKTGNTHKRCKSCSRSRENSQKADYKKRNPDKTNKRRVFDNKKYRQRNREKCKELCRKWYQKNRASQLIKSKQWYENNKEARRDQQRFVKYKITREWFQQKLIEQNSCCAICKKPFTHIPYVDHDHTCCNETRNSSLKSCGRCVRGLLCRICNVMLGHAEDSIQILDSASQYLRRYKETNMAKSIEADIARGEGLPMGGMKKPMKSMGNKQATAESAGSTCQESMPNMGTREQTDMPPTSGMGYPCRPTPKPEAVKAVPADQGSLKKARMYNERSENGGADESAYPGK